jgi:hypothetical protein
VQTLIAGGELDRMIGFADTAFKKSGPDRVDGPPIEINRRWQFKRWRFKFTRDPRLRAAGSQDFVACILYEVRQTPTIFLRYRHNDHR